MNRRRIPGAFLCADCSASPLTSSSFTVAAVAERVHAAESLVPPAYWLSAAFRFQTRLPSLACQSPLARYGLVCLARTTVLSPNGTASRQQTLPSSLCDEHVLESALPVLVAQFPIMFLDTARGIFLPAKTSYSYITPLVIAYSVFRSPLRTIFL